jgi:hypothetical protein
MVKVARAEGDEEDGAAWAAPPSRPDVPLDARQYVALCAEPKLDPELREATLHRYHVPSEAALHALMEEWRDPARRAELETALTDFVAIVRGLALG